MKGDTILALVPLVDSFEGAKTSLKPESEGEKRIDAAYQVTALCYVQRHCARSI